MIRLLFYALAGFFVWRIFRSIFNPVIPEKKNENFGFKQKEPKKEPDLGGTIKDASFEDIKPDKNGDDHE